MYTVDSILKLNFIQYLRLLVISGITVQRIVVIEMPVDYVKLGARVKARREKSRMSQSELASEVDLSTQHVSNIENAKTKVSLEKIVDIANILDCSVDELLCDSVVKAKVIYINEVAGLIESFSDAEVRALPEFLRSYSHFSKLLESYLQRKDV